MGTYIAQEGVQVLLLLNATTGIDLTEEQLQVLANSMDENRSKREADLKLFDEVVENRALNSEVFNQKIAENISQCFTEEDSPEKREIMRLKQEIEEKNRKLELYEKQHNESGNAGTAYMKKLCKQQLRVTYWTMASMFKGVGDAVMWFVGDDDDDDYYQQQNQHYHQQAPKKIKKKKKKFGHNVSNRNRW